MKKAYLLGLVGLTLAMAGCNDMLDVTPRDKFTNDPSFWNNATQVENYTNSMYGNFSGYGYQGTGGSFYFSTLTDDQVHREFENWTFTSVPQSSRRLLSGIMSMVEAPLFGFPLRQSFRNRKG